MGRLEDHVKYDPDTGQFTWLKRQHGRKFNESPAKLSVDGYCYVRIGKPYLAHRLAWYLVHGEWPYPEIDHINRDKSDNRLENLRIATRSINNRNKGLRSDSTSGAVGVHYDKRRGYWRAIINKGGKHVELGRFGTKDDAIACRRAAEIKYSWAN